MKLVYYMTTSVARADSQTATLGLDKLDPAPAALTRKLKRPPQRLDVSTGLANHPRHHARKADRSWIVHRLPSTVK